MSNYNRDDLVEMAYNYLVLAKKQRDIEEEMGLPPSTISRELREFGITGAANIAGKRGWGQKGNHCGIASYENMGYDVTREDIYDFMFGSGRGMSDAEYFGRLQQQYQQGEPRNTMEYDDSGNRNTGNSTDGSEAGGAIIFIIILIAVGAYLRKSGFFAKLGILLLFVVKALAALCGFAFALLYCKQAAYERRWILFALILLFSLWGFAVMFFGDGLLWGAGIWGIGLLIGWSQYK